MASMLKHTHSADILFSEEEPSRQAFANADDSFYSCCSNSARNHPPLKDSHFSHPSQPWPVNFPPKSAQPIPIRGRDSRVEMSRLLPIAPSYSASELSANSQLFADDTDFNVTGNNMHKYKDDNANYKSSGDLYSKSWCGDTFVNAAGGGGLSATKTTQHREIKEYRPCVSDTEGSGSNKQPHSKYGTSKYHNSIPSVPPPKYHPSLHSQSSEQFYVPSSYSNNMNSRNTKTTRNAQGINNSSTQNGGSMETIEDLYTVPHTFDHQRVTRQAVVPQPPANTNNTKPPPTLNFPPPPPPPVAMGDRRRTWSPPAFSRLMEGARHAANIRSYRSNEQLDDVMGDLVEEEESEVDVNPPKLSGKLQQNAHQSLIKPIAFKPVVLPVQPHYGTTSRCPVSPQQPVISAQRSVQGQHSLESQDISPVQAPSNNNSSKHLEKMRAKTLSPYELHSTSLNGTGNNCSYNNSPQQPNQQHQQVITQSTPKIVLYDRKVANTSHHDDGYISQDCHSGSHSHSNSSHSNTSHGSLHNDSDRSFEHSTVSYTNNSSSVALRPVEERSASFNSSGLGRVAAVAAQGALAYGQTPSPSDSGVGELEAMLRDKDSVIQHLRETMEKNETAILQVCAEKEQNWDLELRQAHSDWERRWKQHQQKAFKMEQALLLQLFKLQQERKALKLDIENTKSERDTVQGKYSECMEDLKQTKVKLDEVNWELCQKCGEISLLKSQLKDSKDETVTKKNEVISTKSQLKNYQKTSDQKDHEILTLEAELKRVKEDLATAQGSVVSLQQDLDTAKKEVFNAQQKADLKELQLDMKTKELEKVHIEHSKRINALKSSSPLGKTASPGQKTNGMPSPDSQQSRASPNKDSVSSTATDSEKLSEETGNQVKAELDQLKAEFDKAKVEFTKERDQWLEEKNKVIRYQKHLQLNYVQMYRKNKVLESEVEQLTLDLEKKDLSLMDSKEAGDRRLEGEESMC